MAAGDGKADTVSVAAGAYLTIQPGALEDWSLRSIEHEAEVELSAYDGTNEAIFDSDTGPGAWFFNPPRLLTNTDYIRVKNTNAAAKVISYSALQTK